MSARYSRRELRILVGSGVGAVIISAAMLIFGMGVPAFGTWKPEYAKNPEAVRQWFETRSPTPAVSERLKIYNCCNHADRLRTKFLPSLTGDWSFYSNPKCVTKGCPLKPIPRDIVHTEGIRAIDPKDDNLPEFQQMRREGVLFIYDGKPVCFWPPQPGI